MNEDLDNHYIHRVLEGDVEAFRYFVKTYQQMSYSIAIAIVKNEHDAIEVVQSSFIHSYKSLKSFKKKSLFSSWLYKIVVNESLRNLRKRKSRNKTVELHEASYIFLKEDNHGLRNIELEEKKGAINKVLLEMKPKEALILKLFYLHELSILEIQQITGFSKSNVKILLHRARVSFSKKFKHENYG